VPLRATLRGGHRRLTNRASNRRGPRGRREERKRRSRRSKDQKKVRGFGSAYAHTFF
jgi:hypothetical protein